MSDRDRFTPFLRRAAAEYNEPPQVPANAMWSEVEERLAGPAATSADAPGRLGQAGAPAAVGPADDAPIHAPGYHAPPPAPRDAMWDRIEASLALRRRAAGVGAEGLAARGGRSSPRSWSRRRKGAGWAAALAAAASLVLWIAVDRGAGPRSRGDLEVGGLEVAVPATTSVVQSEPVEPETALERPQVIAAEGSVPFMESEVAATAVAQPSEIESDDDARVAVGEQVGTTVEPRAAFLSDLGPRGDEYMRTRHLDRTATLLTAFRIDQRTPASQMDLASWAGQLLVDTRVFLDMPVSRKPLERALLEDLELVLLQISRLGPDAPDFEWQLARESMEWKGTLMRVRAATAAGQP